MTNQAQYQDATPVNREQEIAMYNAAQSQAQTTQLQVRLNMEPLILEIQNYLQGVQEQIETNKDGEDIVVLKPVSTPLCNKEGCYSILRTIRLIINNQVVQANFWDEGMYEDFMVRFRKDFAQKIAVNMDEYGVSLEEYHGIIADICSTVFAFMSRTYGNKERESYATTFKTTENTGYAMPKRSGNAITRLFGG